MNLCGLFHGINTITSYFGFRERPVAGGSIYHSGLDIAANERYSYLRNHFRSCNLCSDLMGLGGYTVIIQNDTFCSMYCHVSPTFLVYVGQYVTARRNRRYSWSKKCIWYL